MKNDVDYASFVALIDDDEHSARLLTRTMVEQGAHGVQCYGAAASALARLKIVLTDPTATRPSLIVVDLKEHSAANIEFMATIDHLTRRSGIPVVVLTPLTDAQSRSALLNSGASEVFIRHANRDLYRRVAADIVEFWALTQRPEAVGM